MCIRDRDHTGETFSQVLVTDVLSAPTGPQNSLGKRLIEDNSHKPLAELLDSEAGVSTLRNGAGIGKPIVHGLFGNRLTILNNGVAQSGQQWGNDHSPEIDPLSADKVTILKGAGAIEHQGGNLGAVILVQPLRIPKDPHCMVMRTTSMNPMGGGRP